MTKKEFFKQMDSNPKFPTNEQELEWFDEWVELHPEEKLRTEKALIEANEKQACEYMANKIFARMYFEKHTIDGFGEFRLVYDNRKIMIHPFGRDGETLDFKI